MADRTELIAKLASIFINNRSYYQLAMRQDFTDHQQFQRDLGNFGRKPGEKKNLLAALDAGASAATFNAYAQDYASRTVNFALGRENEPKLEGSIYVAEIRVQSDLHLFRAYDGIKASPRSSWWMGTSMLRKITQSSPARQPGDAGKRNVLDFMLSSSFVHPDWNKGKEVARMTVPAGRRLPIISGAGSWRTMAADHTPVKPSPQGVNALEGWNRHLDNQASEEDRIMLMGMLPIEGPKQTFVPLFEQSWITKVDYNSEHWPFA